MRPLFSLSGTRDLVWLSEHLSQKLLFSHSQYKHFELWQLQPEVSILSTSPQYQQS